MREVLKATPDDCKGETLAILDKENNKIVIRLVYDGTPLSGKTTSLQALSQSLGQELYTPEEIYGRTTFFDWMQYTGGLFEGYQIRCQIVSVPGQMVWARRRQQLLKNADAIVFVGETSREKFAESLTVLRGLQKALQHQRHPAGVIFQANKRDLPGALPLTEIQAKLAALFPNALVVESVATKSTGTRFAFVMAVRAALDRVRELIKAAALQEGSPEIQSGEALLQTLKQFEASQSPLEIEDLFNHQLPTHRQAPRESSDISPRSPSPLIICKPLSTPETWDDTMAARLVELEAGSRTPQLPTPDVADGSVWPPIQGRITVKEMTATTPVLRRMENGDWAVQAESDWLVHSYQEDGFLQLTEARQHLIRWAHVHIANNVILSPGRCLVLAKHEVEGWRLWQIVRKHLTLADALQRALAETAAEVIAVKLRQCLNTLALAAATFPDAINYLPFRLATISCPETLACFTDILPALRATNPSRQSSALDLVSAILEDELYPLLESALAENRALATQVAGLLQSRQSASIVPQKTLNRVSEKLLRTISKTDSQAQPRVNAVYCELV